MKLTEITEKFPPVVDVKEMSRRCHVSESRLIELADAGIIPHLRVDNGPPLFRAPETRQWVAENLLKYHGGKEIPVTLMIVTDRPILQSRDVPTALRQIDGLMDVTDVLTLFSGCYFLCKGDQVVYVGQSINVGARIQAHIRTKDFDRVLFLRWPASNLDALEGALIRALNPPLNRTVRDLLLAPGNPDEDREVLANIEGVSGLQ